MFSFLFITFNINPPQTPLNSPGDITVEGEVELSETERLLVRLLLQIFICNLSFFLLNMTASDITVAHFNINLVNV